MNVRGSPGIERAREWGNISAPFLRSPEDPEPGMEGGANARPSEAAETCESACPGTALERDVQAEGGRAGARE